MHGYKVDKKRIYLDKIFHGIFFMSAFFAVISVILITYFIVSKGIKPFLPTNEYGYYNLFDFFTGMEWKPYKELYGIGYMIISTIIATIGALILGVPVAILTAIFIAKIAGKRLAEILKSTVELLAAIPSVLYGVFGFAVIVPAIRSISPSSSGDSLLAVIIVLAIMIMPTIISVSETAIRAVPKSYIEGSLALGSTNMQTIFKVVLPSAKSGILAAVVLGVGRAIGETMAVILVAGNPESGIPTSLFDKIRLLTTNIALEQGYAAELHEQMLFSTAVVLLFFILILNGIMQKIKSSIGDK